MSIEFCGETMEKRARIGETAWGKAMNSVEWSHLPALSAPSERASFVSVLSAVQITQPPNFTRYVCLLFLRMSWRGDRSYGSHFRSAKRPGRVSTSALPSALFSFPSLARLLSVSSRSSAKPHSLVFVLTRAAAIAAMEPR